MISVFVILIMLVIISCNDDTQKSEFTNNSTTICSLTIVDSIGIAYGDSNLVFGSIEDVDIGADGSIFVLDKLKLRLFVFDSNGVFIRTIGRSGNGPGELNNPGFFCVCKNGNICIADGVTGWHRYDSTGNCLSTHPIDPYSNIRDLVSFSTTEILGIQSIHQTTDDGAVYYDMILCRWNSSDPYSILAKFSQKDYTFSNPRVDPDNFALDAIRFANSSQILFDAGDGFVCVAPEPKDNPMLLLFEPDGSIIDTLFLPYTRVSKTQLEIESEIRFIEERYSNLSVFSGMEWVPSPYHPMIASVGVDSLNQIWVQRGFEQDITFDLYNLSCEHIMTAILPSNQNHNTFNWELYVNENGIAAVPQDPIEYFVIYLLDSNM